MAPTLQKNLFIFITQQCDMLHGENYSEFCEVASILTLIAKQARSRSSNLPTWVQTPTKIVKKHIFYSVSCKDISGGAAVPRVPLTLSGYGYELLNIHTFMNTLSKPPLLSSAISSHIWRCVVVVINNAENESETLSTSVGFHKSNCQMRNDDDDEGGMNKPWSHFL